MSETFSREINAVPHNFSKIIWGTSGLKKIERVYDKFSIPSSENIVAYIKSAVPFAGPLIIITDGGIYSFLNCQFSFSEICKYIVTQADEKASVVVSDATADQTILGGTLIAKNLAGMELLQFIEAMQNQLTQNYPWARQQRDALVNQVMKTARDRMRTGRIPEDIQSKLGALEQENAYRDTLIFLKAEDIFRACNFTDYQNFLNSLPVAVSKETQQALQTAKEKFTSNLVRDLSDIDLDFSTDYLRTVYGNLSAQASPSESFCLISAYICIRLNKTEQFQKVKGQICRYLGENTARNLELFKECYYNARMQRVYDMIRSGDVPAPEQLEWTDSLGLTPLHYAFILRKSQVIESLLDARQWTRTDFMQTDDEAAELLDYTVAACYCGVSNRVAVFQKTSDMVAAQLRSKKALEKRLRIKQKKLDFQKSTAQKTKSAIRQAEHGDIDRNKIYEAQEKLENLIELISETQIEVDELHQEICDIDFEIQELTDDALFNAVNVIQRLQASKSPMVQFLLHLFSDSSLLLHIISDCQDICRIYTYGGITFVTPTDVQLNLPYEEGRLNQEEPHCEEGTTDDQRNAYTRQERQAKQETSHERITRPYGDSWFSPQAHGDLKKLKEEYHALAKQYHPDKCQDPRSKEIFQEILNERADILEHMNR